MCVQNPGRIATVTACVHQVSQVQQLLTLAAQYWFNNFCENGRHRHKERHKERDRENLDREACFCGVKWS
jgi:hypothetical protein